MRFHVGMDGMQFWLSSQARTQISAAPARDVTGTSACQKIQHHCLPNSLGSSKTSSAAIRQLLPPFKVTSTRCTGLPAPLYAYPSRRKFSVSDKGIFVEWLGFQQTHCKFRSSMRYIGSIHMFSFVATSLLTI